MLFELHESHPFASQRALDVALGWSGIKIEIEHLVLDDQSIDLILDINWMKQHKVIHLRDSNGHPIEVHLPILCIQDKMASKTERVQLDTIQVDYEFPNVFL